MGERYVFQDLSPEGINEGISKVANERARKTEQVLREHLESHEVLDFLRTSKRLENDLYQQHSGIRPHIYPRDFRSWHSGPLAEGS